MENPFFSRTDSSRSQFCLIERLSYSFSATANTYVVQIQTDHTIQVSPRVSHVWASLRRKRAREGTVHSYSGGSRAPKVGILSQPFIGDPERALSPLAEHSVWGLFKV